MRNSLRLAIVVTALVKKEMSREAVIAEVEKSFAFLKATM